MPEEKQFSTPGGARRSGQAPGFHRIPRAGLVRLAERFELGAGKYGEGNWTKGLQSEEDAFLFCREAFNHMADHLFRLGNGEEPDEDHLAAIAWGTFTIMHAESMYGKPWRTFKQHPPTIGGVK